MPLLPRSVLRAPHRTLCTRMHASSGGLTAEQMVSPMSFHFVFDAYSILPPPSVGSFVQSSILQYLFPMAKPRRAESNRSKILGNVGELTTVGSRQRYLYRGGVQAGMNLNDVTFSCATWSLLLSLI